jgi:hypothetical protein
MGSQQLHVNVENEPLAIIRQAKKRVLIAQRIRDLAKKGLHQPFILST